MLFRSAEVPSIVAQRKLEPKRLTKLVSGELDWIVMKCLEKDRARFRGENPALPGLAYLANMAPRFFLGDWSEA